MKCLRFPIPQCPPTFFSNQTGETQPSSSRQPLLFFGNGSSKKLSLVFSIQPLSPESK